MKEGWLCPRCGQINAPFMGACTCKPDKMSNTDDSKSISCKPECDHNWNYENGTRTCKYCGKSEDLIESACDAGSTSEYI